MSRTSACAQDSAAAFRLKSVCKREKFLTLPKIPQVGFRESGK